jgi:hypothetical protein
VNIDPNITELWASPEIQELIQEGEIDEAKLRLLGSEELEKSTLEQWDGQWQEGAVEADSPSLTIPNYDLLLSMVSGGEIPPESLTDEAIKSYLDDSPEFAAFLNEQNLVSETDIYESVRQKILENPGSTSSVETLAAAALAETMEGVLQSTGDPAIKEMLDATRAKILIANNPSAQVLIEAIERDLIAQGVPPEEAKKQAIAEALGEIDALLSETGVAASFHSTHPEMDNAIASLLISELGGTEEARNFVANLTEIVGIETALMAAFDKMAAVQSDEGVESVSFAKYQGILGSSQELVEAAMAQIDKLPLPGNQKTAILEFMKTISAALAELEKVMSEIEMADLKRSRIEMRAEIERIKLELKSQLKEIQKALKKIKKAKKKGGVFGKMGKIGDILAPLIIAFVVIAFVVVAILIIALSIITAPMGGFIIGIILMTLLIMAFAAFIAAVAVSEAGKTDKMFDTFMAAGEGMGLSEAATAGIIAGIALVIGILFPPVLLVVGPEMLVRSGAFGMAAEEIGGRVGMDENQIMQFEGALRTIGYITASSGGMTGSHTFFEVSKKDQERLRSQVSVSSDKRNVDSAFSRVDAYSNVGLTQTLNQAARTSPEALEERREEMQKMIAMLTKIIAQMKDLLVALMAGDPGAINSAIEGMQTLADEGMSGFTLTSKDEQLLQPMVEAGAETVAAALPAFLPSESTIEEQQRQQHYLESQGFSWRREEKRLRAREILS